MRPLSRRSLFAMPLAVPAAALAAALPLPTAALAGKLKPFAVGHVFNEAGTFSFGFDNVEFRRLRDEIIDDCRVFQNSLTAWPRVRWTDDELAATLGIESSPSQPDPPA